MNRTMLGAALAVVALAVPLRAAGQEEGDAIGEAQAGEAARAPGWPTGYVVARAGTFAVRDPHSEALRLGPAVEVGVGWYVTPAVALELGAGHDRTRSRASASPEPGVVIDDWELDVSRAAVTVKAVSALRHGELFFAAGAGVYLAERHETGRFEESNGWVRYGGRVNSDVVPGAHVGAGATVYAGRRAFLVAEARFTILEAELFGEYDRLDGLRVDVGLGYAF
jgi:hypothetical protein